MPKKAKELSALAVSRLRTPGYHAVGGVAGLYLQFVSINARSWILRTIIGGKRREIGLGGFPDTPLADAKIKARKTKDAIEAGADPIREKREARRKLAAEREKAVTFKVAATAYIAAHEAGWKNAKHAAQWTSTLEHYAYPIVGDVLVRDIALSHILKILEPIWTTKSETASRLRGRIEKVLDWATVREYRAGNNPARWRGNLDTQLKPRSKVAEVEHHAALPYDQMGTFMVELRKAQGMGARALEFAILTAARSGEVRGAKWEEIDLKNAVWVIPASRMKAGKEHHVPLAPAAVDLLKALPRVAEIPFVFPGSKGPLSDMSLTASLKRMGRTNITAHGFRSSFRDWAGERTNYPREVCEHALAHQLKDKSEAAYQRGTLFDKRRMLMNDWANCCGKCSVDTAAVVPMSGSN
jgi:integrase